MKFITVEEAAQMSKLSGPFIRFLAIKGRIPAKKIGKRMWLVDPGKLMDQSYLKDMNSKRRSYRRGNKPAPIPVQEEQIEKGA